MKRVFSLVVISLLCLSMFTIFAPKASASSDLLLLPAAPYGWQYSDSSHNTLMVNPLAGPLVSVSEQSIIASPGQTVSVSVTYQVFVQSPPNNPGEIDQLFFVESWTTSWPPQGYTIPLYYGSPGLSPGVTQTNTVSFTVPSASGTYYLWLCFEAQYSMQDAVNQRTQSMTGLPGHIKVVVAPSAAPVGYWKFDEGPGSIAYDSSGNGNNGVIHTATWTDGIIGKALHFNGVDSWVEVPNSPSLTGLSQITLEAWVQEDSITAQLKGIISKCDGWAPPTNAEYFLGTNAGGNVFFETDHGTAIFSAQTTPLITEAGRWYHVAGTWSGNSYTIYVDGVPVLSGTCTQQTTLSNTLPVQIGRHGTWSWVYFQGIIDEVKIYNYARTAEEIQSDYAQGGAPASDLLSLPAAPYGWQYSDSSHNTLMVNPLAGHLLSVSEQDISASPGQTVSVSVTYQVFAQMPPNNPSEIDQLFFVESWTTSWPPQGYTMPLYNGIPGLSPGVTQTNTVSFTVPSVSGTYYLWLCFEAQYSMQDAINQRTQPMTGLPGHIKIVVTPLANQPPSVPTIPNVVQGVQIVQSGNLLDFTSSATDPDGDKISITFDWGDGAQDTVGPTNSPASVIHDHSWTGTGMFEVKAKATDEHNAESGWSLPLDVTVVANPNTVDDHWAGYIAKSTTPVVSSIEAQWIQPNYNIGLSDVGAKTGTWAGIGGTGGTNLLQAGIVSSWWGGTCPFYATVVGKSYNEVCDWGHWSRIGTGPNTGDLMEASISLIGANSWQISVTDITQGWTPWVSVVTFEPDLTTGEWIHEPAATTSPIVSFSAIAFTKARVTMGGTTYRVGDHTSGLNLWNFGKNGITCTAVSEITNYERFTISDTGNRPASAVQTTTLLQLHSCADIHVYDSSGRHDGYNSTSGLIDAEIPNSLFAKDASGTQWVVLNEPDKYRIDLAGTTNGDFHLCIQAFSEQTVVLDEWINGTTSLGTMETHHLYVPPQGTPVVDDTPSTTKLIIGEPKCVAPTRTYVTKDTLFTLTANDGTGSGVAETAYRISNSAYDSGWTHYATPFNLTSLSDGNYKLAFNSTDKAGNIEATNAVNVTLAHAIILLSGNKHITLTGSDNVVIITGGNDIIDATQATATTVIKTGTGNDIINLGGGNNIVTETAGGNDIITTGNGNNTITITGYGNYQITTGSGNDQIQITGDGNSIINAGNGNNAVTVSGKGNNQITTGSGNDAVAAGNGNNIIKTGSGNDSITVGNGNNNIDGGTGYDICIHGTGHNTILNCEKT